MRTGGYRFGCDAFELIGLKIVFDVDARHVGKTPHRDMGVHPAPTSVEDWAVRGGVEAQFTFQIQCF